MASITITLEEGLAGTLRSVLRKRRDELDRYLLRGGDHLDSVEHQLTKDVRADVGRCLEIVEFHLPEKARA